MSKNEQSLSTLMKTYKQGFVKFKPFAKKNDKIKWANITNELSELIIEDGKSVLHYQFTLLPATLFMEFMRNGNRTRFQTLYFSRRRILNSLILAECCENKNEFLDDIINGIMALCEESGWQLPAHNRYGIEQERQIVPDISRPIIDLFSAETGAQLAMAAYLLEDDLNKISPLFVQRISSEIRNRIQEPYLNEHFFWMGKNGQKLNNWTPWCTSNVLIAILLMDELTPEKKRAVLEKACNSLDLFIESYEDDGFCEEGPSYYHEATLALFEALRVLNAVTNGHFNSVYKSQKIQNMLTYITAMHISDDSYANYSDSRSILKKNRIRDLLAAQEINNEEMQEFAVATHHLSEAKTDTQGINLYLQTQNLWYENKIKNVKPSKQNCFQDRFFENAGVLVARGKSLYVAVLGGRNNDAHGHNDKGHFIVYKNGHPLFIDVGVESYTKKTFSEERYTIWTMQSAYHNVINFGEHMQQRGAAYHAKILSAKSGGKVACVKMELANAYELGVIESYERNVSLDKGEKLIISDTLSSIPENTYLSLMTVKNPSVKGNILCVGEEKIALKGFSKIEVEKIELFDKKLQKEWGKCVYRIKMSVCEKETAISMSDNEYMCPNNLKRSKF